MTPEQAAERIASRCCTENGLVNHVRAAAMIRQYADAVTAEVRAFTDNRPAAFFELLDRRARELVPDYPFDHKKKSDAFDLLWAITSSLEGTGKACDDLHADLTALKARNASLAAEYELCAEALRKCREVYREIYPSLAGRVMQLEAAGESKAAAEWNRIASLVFNVLQPQEAK